MEERRKFRRSGTKEKASLESREGHKHESNLLDISPGGMRILSDASVKVGSVLTGRFKIMPNSGHFFVSGEVRWVKPAEKAAGGHPYEIGIKFNKVSTIPL